MKLIDYQVALNRFGLQRLSEAGVIDLAIDAKGDLAMTRDFDLQAGDTKHSALFRLIERWRASQPTIDALFCSLSQAEGQKLNLIATRQQISLSKNARDFHAVSEGVKGSDHAAGAVGGALAVLLDNLLMRLKLDLGAQESEWKTAGPSYAGQSLGQTMNAAAANFRHYDEWASSSKPTTQQLKSLKVLCPILGLPEPDPNGLGKIRKNVCGDVFQKITGGSVDKLHEDIFFFAKALAKF